MTPPNLGGKLTSSFFNLIPSVSFPNTLFPRITCILLLSEPWLARALDERSDVLSAHGQPSPRAVMTSECNALLPSPNPGLKQMQNPYLFMTCWLSQESGIGIKIYSSIWGKSNLTLKLLLCGNSVLSTWTPWLHLDWFFSETKDSNYWIYILQWKKMYENLG